LTVDDTYVEQGAVTNEESNVTITDGRLKKAETYEIVHTATNSMGTTTAIRIFKPHVL